jgi:hypothetical protein
MDGEGCGRVDFDLNAAKGIRKRMGENRWTERVKLRELMEARRHAGGSVGCVPRAAFARDVAGG